MSTCTDTKVPWGIWCLRLGSRFGPINPRNQIRLYRMGILVVTFLSYVCFHMSRKPISVVKPVILNCTDDPHHAMFIEALDHRNTSSNCTSFINEMSGKDSSTAHKYLGFLDTSFLTSYAVFMFFSGYVAERVNLRYFLSAGMILSGLFTALFGFGKLTGIHHISYYVVMQFLNGAVQSSGWPGVVTVVANWFGKGKKGFIFGVWNAHTSIGNILGGVLAGVFVDKDWAMSFIVPGLIIACMGLVVWFWMPVKPSDLGFDQQELIPAENVQYSRIRRTYSSFSDEETASIPSQGLSSGETTPLLQQSSSSDVEERPAAAPEADQPVVNDLNENPEPAVNRHNLRRSKEEAITFIKGWQIPGVAEFALCLFFCKLVSYTFLYWLPSFIYDTGKNVSSEDAAYLATLFDVGGIVGGIIAGLATDRTGRPATCCAIMIVLAIPSMFSYNYFGQQCRLDPSVTDSCYIGNIALLMLSGLMVNGPYALITTAVSAELGTHKSLKGSAKALATVTAIIDGTGSVGAAVGPYLAGALQGSSGSKNNVFYMLMAADVLSMMLLTRLVVRETRKWLEERRSSSERDGDHLEALTEDT